MTHAGGRTCVWQWKVSEEGETQGSSAKVGNTHRSGWAGGVGPHWINNRAHAVGGT